MKRIVNLFVAGLAITLIVGCCRIADKEKLISRIFLEAETNTIVEDIATGKVLSDDTKMKVIWEQNFKWEDKRLAKLTYTYGGEVESDQTYVYENGVLARIDDKYGPANYFNYENGLLRSIVDSNGYYIEFYYDEAGHIIRDSTCMKNGKPIYEGLPYTHVDGYYEYEGDDLVKSALYFRPSGVENAEAVSYCFYGYGPSAPKNPITGIFILNIMADHSDRLSGRCYITFQQKQGLGDHIEEFEILTSTYTVDEDNYPVTAHSQSEKSVESEGRRTTVKETFTYYYEYL